MLQDFKQELASMYSLIKRMDNHYTINESKCIDEDILTEAVANQSGKLEPNATMIVDVDNSNRTRVLKIFVGPLFMQDIKRLDNLENCDGPIKNNGLNGVIFTKSLPYNKKQKDSTSTAQDNTNNANITTQPKQQSGKLLSLLRKHAQNNDNSLNEGLLQNFRAKHNIQQTDNTNQTTNKKDNSIVTWFNNVFIPAIKSISNNTNYEKSHLANLTDANFLLQKYLVAPEKNDTNYNEETTEEIKKQVSEAIKNSDWQSIKNIFTPINLESIIFGNVLSLRNQLMIKNQAAKYGINPGDPNYPTNLYAPGKWEKKFNRKVRPDAKYKWFTMSPRTSDNNKDSEMGSKGHYDEFGKNLNGFQPAYLYDISDTEILDPNDTTDYMNDIPGVINNFTGELNNAAKQYKDDLHKSQEKALSSEQAKLFQEIQTDEGKAKIYNDALISYAGKHGISISLKNISNNNNAVMDYASNLLTISEFIIKKMRYSNPTIVEPLKMITAFAIACRTIGANEIISISSNIQTDKQTLLNDWDNACNITLQAVTSIVNYVIRYLTVRYAKFNVDNTDVSQQNIISQNSLNEMYNNIEYLLNEL